LICILQINIQTTNKLHFVKAVDFYYDMNKNCNDFNELLRNELKSIYRISDYFRKYGELRRAYVIYHPETGVSRGFGYIHYKDKNSIEVALKAEGMKNVKNFKVERFSLNVKRAYENNRLPENRNYNE